MKKTIIAIAVMFTGSLLAAVQTPVDKAIKSIEKEDKIVMLNFVAGVTDDFPNQVSTRYDMLVRDLGNKDLKAWKDSNMIVVTVNIGPRTLRVKPTDKQGHLGLHMRTKAWGMLTKYSGEQNTASLPLPVHVILNRDGEELDKWSSYRGQVKLLDRLKKALDKDKAARAKKQEESKPKDDSDKAK